MTISTTTNTVLKTGDGVTTAFDVKNGSDVVVFFEDSHLKVKVAGVLKTLNVDYTVTGAGDENGGTVTFNVAPANAADIEIQRIVPYDQNTDFENFDGNPADVTEKQFDLLVMQAQQLAEIAARAFQMPVGTTGVDMVVPALDGNAMRVLIVNAGETGFEWGPTTANLETLAGIVADITTVAGIAANVTTVAGISANVTTVAGISSAVSNVSSISAAVSNVSSISAAVSGVNAIAANVTTVAGVAADVTAVAAIAAAVSAVNANAANINTVSTNIASINVVAADLGGANTIGAAATFIATYPKLSDIGGLDVTDGNIIVGNGTTWVAESGATARASLGLTIGTNVQAYNANLTTWAGKTVPSGTVVGTTDTQTLTNKTITAANIKTFTVTLADDAATSFDPTAYGGEGRGIILIKSSTENACAGIAWYNTLGGGMASFFAQADLNILATNTTLAGTTSTDVKFNISAASDGKIYLENRRGGSETYQVTIF